MKKILLYLALIFISSNIKAQTITKSSGWLESAFVEWTPVAGADSYNVYYTGGGETNKKIDEQLIRSYGTYFRADVPGLAAGSYILTVKPVTVGVESIGTTTSSLTVLAHDRSGFAFSNGRVPGAYNLNGTLKNDAVVLYITQNTKNTIAFSVVTNANGTTKTNYVGLQGILDGFKKGLDKRPLAIRLIGNITDPATLYNGDIVIENKRNALSSITMEGIGNDAVVNGWGIRIKTATNIEIRNLGFMLTDASEGDNIGLQQDNDYIWVHNCDLFYGAKGGDADQAKGDGALDAKKSTYITFSYNHFWDSGKSNLLGLSEGKTTDLYITYHHNWYDHSDSRHPRVRYYSAHIYNNYYDGNSKYGAGSTLGSSLFMEANFFRNCKYPMLISKQGTDTFGGAVGTFSGEAGGTIKAFNNVMSGQTRYVPYNATTNPIEFDAIEVGDKTQAISNTIKSKLGANTYNNFDIDPAIMYTYTPDSPEDAKTKVMLYSGRVEGGDFKHTFNNAVDDTSSDVNAVLMNGLISYTTKLVLVQGEVAPVVNTQTLVATSNNDQTVTNGNAISSIVYTWGGDATDVTVEGLPESGINFIKDSAAKTITVTGTPTADVSFSVTTIGILGTPVTVTGSVTIGEPPVVVPAGDQIHNFTDTYTLANNFYTMKGNLSDSKGTVSYNELTLTKGLKIESKDGTVSYTTTQPTTLTLVFAEAAAKIKIDDVSRTASSGIITLTLPAGNHTLGRDSGTTTVYYIKTSYPTLGLVDNVQTSKLAVYPNPVSNQLFISSQDQKVKDVMIYNLSGTVVKNISNLAEETVDVSDLATGNYVIKVTTDQGIATRKIVKK
ncbi:T9SS type A sorting domain-containing protein [Flavobacterium gyeonganense]|uniref:T9SS type A sorting domain-containing protein n=1 Tax=Flavobacterium gyeonganense TaxID=1310418 RepID=A0ABV5HBR4_9FLAO|nr:T9SS type A sorting domain-containing protein [Flavobacterium gyeonganense]